MSLRVKGAQISVNVTLWTLGALKSLEFDKILGYQNDGVPKKLKELKDRLDE